MKEQESDWKSYHHQLYQLYHGLIAISLIPFALLFLEWDSQNEGPATKEWLRYFVIISNGAVVVFGSWQVWKGKHFQYAAMEQADLVDKLKHFKSISIRKYITLMLVGLTCAGFLWVAPTLSSVIGYFAVLVQYSFLRPSEDLVVREMRLTKKEREALHKKSIAQD